MLGSEPGSSAKAVPVALEPFLQPPGGESFNILIFGGWVAGWFLFYFVLFLELTTLVIFPYNLNFSTD